MKNFALGVAAVALVSSSVSAQDAAAPAAAAQPAVAEVAAPAAAPAPMNLSLAAGTPITLAVAEEVSSSTHKAGDTFKLTVLNDVTVGSTVVIPRGTPASAVITWRTGKGAFGKSGKLEFDLTHIDLGGRAVPVKGSFRQEGEGNTVATGVGVIAIGIFAGFITGKRARLPQGRELMSQLAQETPFTADGKLAAEFDSNGAMAAAEAKTPYGQCKATASAVSNPKKREKALEDCQKERMD